MRTRAERRKGTTSDEQVTKEHIQGTEEETRATKEGVETGYSQGWDTESQGWEEAKGPTEAEGEQQLHAGGQDGQDDGVPQYEQTPEAHLMAFIESFEGYDLEAQVHFKTRTLVISTTARVKPRNVE